MHSASLGGVKIAYFVLEIVPWALLQASGLPNRYPERPCQRGRSTKLLPPKTFDPHILLKPHRVEVVLFQEFAEQICRKYLVLQPLQANPPNAFCDDPVQRRGADFIRNGPQERNVPRFLADNAKSQAQIAISVIFALFEAFPNCILLLSPRLKIQFQPLPGCVALHRLGNIVWTEK